MLRTCSICKIDKELTSDNFAWKNKVKQVYQWHCKPCQKEYRTRHYNDRKQYYIDKSSTWRNEQKIIFYEWLSQQKCCDCSLSDIRVLEFDHLHDKEFEISKKIGSVLFETLLIEIEKCDIVCRNCHAIRTAERGNWYGFLRGSNSIG